MLETLIEFFSEIATTFVIAFSFFREFIFPIWTIVLLIKLIKLVERIDKK